MSAHVMPTPYVVRQLLRYDPESGKLFWRPRPEFLVSKSSGKTLSHSKASFDAQFAGREAFTAKNGNGYLCGRVRGHSITAHRVAFAIFYGKWPNICDHIDGDKLNNRISNLRSVDCAGNARNASMRKDSTTGFSGVSIHKPNGKYRAYYFINGKMKSVGYFSTLVEAVEARAIAIEGAGFSQLHGRRQSD